MNAAMFVLIYINLSYIHMYINLYVCTCLFSIFLVGKPIAVKSIQSNNLNNSKNFSKQNINNFYGLIRYN